MCSVKKVFLEISQNSQQKHLCQSLFFNKVADLRPATLLKTRLWHRCFHVNFVKFLRTPFCIEHHWVAASESHRKSPLKEIYSVLPHIFKILCFTTVSTVEKLPILYTFTTKFQVYLLIKATERNSLNKHLAVEKQQSISLILPKHK